MNNSDRITTEYSEHTEKENLRGLDKSATFLLIDLKQATKIKGVSCSRIDLLIAPWLSVYSEYSVVHSI